MEYEEKRKRKKRFNIRMSEEEEAIFSRNFEASGYAYKNEYVLNLIFDTTIINVDLNIVEKMNYEINMIGNNINQISKKLNQTGVIEQENIEDIIKFQNEIKKLQRKILKQFIKNLLK